MVPKKSKGRQKIKMTKMEKESNLMVTFSKRRSGLFKKASELAILCGVEIGVIVFSPGKKAFSFGHPSVEMIIDRFFTQNPPSNSSTSQLMNVHRKANIDELNRQLACTISHLEVERNKSEALNKMRKEGQESCWLEAPIESLRIQDLEVLKGAMGRLKNSIDEQKKRHLAIMASPIPNVPADGLTGINGDYFRDLKGSGLELSMTPHGILFHIGDGFEYFKNDVLGAWSGWHRAVGYFPV
ncbi:agamous-like MADS-box protein AGL62 [Rutidosis leptorrhynchoides]|uniref:agamous-like MADS-box protein AGL62 n=1 Tax=Rutidosis leptorrhynchoides TaxID=125765 RepID=UPI003A9A5906